MVAKKVYMLELYMKKYGFTQSEMAATINTCVSNFANKLNGKTKFFGDEMVAIRGAINDRAVANGDASLSLDDIFLLI